MCIPYTLVYHSCAISLSNTTGPDPSRKPQKRGHKRGFWGFPIWARSKVCYIWGRCPEKRPFLGLCAILRFQPVRTTNIVEVCPIMCNQSSYNDDKLMCDPGLRDVRHVRSVTRGCDHGVGIWGAELWGVWGTIRRGQYWEWQDHGPV